MSLLTLLAAANNGSSVGVDEANNGAGVKSQMHHLWIRAALNALPKPEEGRASTLLPMPSPLAADLLLAHPRPSEHANGILLVASILWEGRNTKDKTMRLPKNTALKFVRSLPPGVNPTSFVCEAWGCKLLSKGSNLRGNQTNVWSYPSWADGRTIKLPVSLTPYQRKRWRNRNSILVACSNKANPAAAWVRETLAMTTESSDFTKAALALTEKGEIIAVRCYRAAPTKINTTKDGDIQSVVSRLPETLRTKLLIDGQDVAEFDIKSAHAVLLGILYKGEAGADWAAERSRFLAEAGAGFVSIYGDKKQHKVKFLSALNQRAVVSRNASHGYREFERMFPLLAEKSGRVRWRDSKALGSLLRHSLAVIMRDMVLGNHADGIRTVPVVDSAVVAMPRPDHWKQHQAEFRTAWRMGVPIKEATGASALIEGSNRVNYQFFVAASTPVEPNLTEPQPRNGKFSISEEE